MMADEEDRNTFYDYLITNVKLHFDKAEEELKTALPEPTTSEYETEKASPEEEGEEEIDLGAEEEIPPGPEEELPPPPTGF